MSMKFTEFIKPDFKKIRLILILASLLWIQIISDTLHPLMILYVPFLILLCFFGYFDCPPPWVPYYVAFAVSLLVTILFWYFISCLIVLAWNKIVE